jgi:hypothetical protein
VFLFLLLLSALLASAAFFSGKSECKGRSFSLHLSSFLKEKFRAFLLLSFPDPGFIALDPGQLIRTSKRVAEVPLL